MYSLMQAALIAGVVVVAISVVVMMILVLYHVMDPAGAFGQHGH